MSRFFDLLQRLSEQRGISASASIRAGSASTAGASELDQTLSILLPKAGSDPEHLENGSESRQILSVRLRQGADYPEDIEKASEFEQIPVQEVDVQPESRIVFHTDPNSPGADRFRFLRMHLRALWNTKKLKTILITSPMPGDGKSTITLNLATALAEGGKRTVLLMEADLHRSPLAQVDLKTGPGLAECLENGLSPLEAIRRIEPLGWYLLSAGEPRSNPTELLQGEGLSRVMQKLSPHFDWILIDSPPVVPMTDALSLSRHANGSLLVARAGHTQSDAIEKAIALLGRERVLGVVLNGVEELKRLNSGYYTYSGDNHGRKCVERIQHENGALAGSPSDADHSVTDLRQR